MSGARGTGIAVVVVDGERTFADAVAARLAAEEDVASVAVVGAPTVAAHLAVRRTDVLLLDADLDAGVAIRLCEESTGCRKPNAHAAPRVVMLSASPGAERIVAAIRAGAAAWVRKDESLAHLLRVIRGVVNGETWLPPAETGNVLRLLLAERDSRRDRDRLVATLTPREREVLAYLAQGTGSAEMAQRLHLSGNTIRTHLQHVMAKLGVHSAVEAVALTRSLVDGQGLRT